MVCVVVSGQLDRSDYLSFENKTLLRLLRTQTCFILIVLKTIFTTERYSEIDNVFLHPKMT